MDQARPPLSLACDRLATQRLARLRVCAVENRLRACAQAAPAGDRRSIGPRSSGMTSTFQSPRVVCRSNANPGGSVAAEANDRALLRSRSSARTPAADRHGKRAKLLARVRRRRHVCARRGFAPDAERGQKQQERQRGGVPVADFRDPCRPIAPPPESHGFAAARPNIRPKSAPVSCPLGTGSLLKGVR